MRYDYKCKKCGNTQEFELPMNFEAEDRLECDKCGGSVERIYSVPNLVNSNSSKIPPCKTGNCPFANS